MQVQIDIEFNQLVEIVRKLPSRKLKRLKAEIDKGATVKKATNLEELLLSGPTATKKELDTILNNRKEVNQWRTR